MALTRLQVRNPRSGEYDYSIGVAEGKVIASIAQALRAAQPAWRDLGIQRRIGVLRRWKQALQHRGDDIRKAIRTDTGRHFIADGEFGGLLRNIDRWCAQAPDLFASPERASAAFPDVALKGQREPYPLLGVISPWNFPLLLSLIDAVPALLAGCAAIVKPSEVTPRFAEPLGAAIAAVPELQEVLRFISGDGRSGAALIEHVDVVAFTGSVASGRKVAAAAAAAFIPAFLELGGKDPAIVLAGADIDRAATSILRASVSATGQACQSLERVYVHDSAYDEFVEVITQKARDTPLSYPDPDAGIVGPLIFEKQADIIRSQLEDAVAKGAQIRAGGEVRDLGGGKWIAPTVLTGVNHDMSVMTEETFGPVIPIMPFTSEDNAIELANDSQYGLSGAVFAANEADAQRVAARMNAGGISINDAGMTTIIFEAEKSAFNLSGMGPSRMGASGLTRFFRQKALFINRGRVMPIEALTEGQG